MITEEYINQGYRAYKLGDFPVGYFVTQLPNLSRRHRLEIVVVNEVVYIKDTNKYDNKNPYLK